MDLLGVLPGLKLREQFVIRQLEIISIQVLQEFGVHFEYHNSIVLFIVETTADLRYVDVGRHMDLSIIQTIRQQFNDNVIERGDYVMAFLSVYVNTREETIMLYEYRL